MRLTSLENEFFWSSNSKSVKANSLIENFEWMLQFKQPLRWYFLPARVQRQPAVTKSVNFFCFATLENKRQKPSWLFWRSLLIFNTIHLVQSCVNQHHKSYLWKIKSGKHFDYSPSWIILWFKKFLIPPVK